MPGATVEPTSGLVTLPGHTGLDELIAAVDRNWQDAFNAQVAAEEYPDRGVSAGRGSDKARYPLPTASSTASPRKRCRPPSTGRRPTCGQSASSCWQSLRRARLSNEISEEQDGQGLDGRRRPGHADR